MSVDFADASQNRIDIDIHMNTGAGITVSLAAIGWLCWLGALSAGEPKFNVATKRADDRIDVSSKGATTTFSVRSPTGIGSATISRMAGDWPERLILRLHLQGLEGLKVSNGQLEFVAEVVAQDKKRFLQVTKNSQPGKPPEPKKLADYEIHSFEKNGKPTQVVPLQDGYFEVRLPKELFTDDPKSITINWIDFYR